jgi:hypothetical protein
MLAPAAPLLTTEHATAALRCPVGLAQAPVLA